MRTRITVGGSAFRTTVAVAWLVLSGAPASAHQPTIKENAKEAGRAVGTGIREVAEGAKQVGAAVSEAAKEVAQAAKEGGKELKRAVKGERNDPPKNDPAK